MVTSTFSKFDFRPVISISDLQFYTYVCYTQIWLIQFYWLWHRPLYRLLRPHLNIPGSEMTQHLRARPPAGHVSLETERAESIVGGGRAKRKLSSA